jgi:acetolactate synthase small subunit
VVLIDLNQEEVKRLIAIMQFSIAACPLGSISQEVEIDADKIENLIAKMEKGLE